ncbi:MAG: RES family NAD+ phosphorylase, partial [Candidatus Eremiobacteraeota bacterium]|nr:RES family NAD+ phosphorylase [Candidatus Eremiobacteraeota bacterium]
RPIVYCSAHPATALVEWIVHLELDSDQIPTTIPYITLDVPDELHSERIATETLPLNWRADTSISRELGDEWLASARSALFYVPSAIVPEAENVLLNPSHSDFSRVTINGVRDEPW